MDDLSKPYEPALIYYPDADVAEYVTKDAPIVYRFVSPGVALALDMSTRAIIGFRIECPKEWGAAVASALPARTPGS